MSSRVHACEDSVGVAAPAGVVYGMLADAARWPVFLPSVVHVERLDFDGVQERLRMWELADEAVNGAVWCAGRPGWFLAHPAGAAPRCPGGRVRAGGRCLAGQCDLGCVECAVRRARRSVCWLCARNAGCRRLRTVPVPAGRRRRTCTALLAQVQQAAERWEQLDELLLSFEDRVRIEGPAELVYDFLYRIEDWPERVPHVEWASVCEDVPGIQVASLDTCAAPGGRTVSTRAVRLCFPHAGRIVYKETLTPDLIAAHSGEWSLLPDASGVTVVAAHQVMLRQEAVLSVLGAGTGLLEARDHVRAWLSRASTEALGLAKWHAESTVRRLR
ncbi:SRPBCC family protein [Streptomyces sp. S1D4-11]